MRLARDLPDVRLYATRLGRLQREQAQFYRANGEADRAKAAERAAAGVWKRLGGEDVREDRSPLRLAGMCLELAEEARGKADLVLCRDAYAGAIRLLEDLRQQDPRLRAHLVRAHMGRAMALADLKDYQTALPHWEQALRLEGNGPNRASLRLGWAITLGRAGDYARATTEADALANLGTLSREAVYSLARVHGRAAAVVRADARLQPAERDRLATRYAERAVALLRRARTAQFFVAGGRVDLLQKDKDFDALRSRDDFKMFVEELTKTLRP